MSKLVIKKIFLASPSDTIRERKKVNQVIEEINSLLGDLLKIKFEIIKWETHAAPSMGRPQEVINKQLNIEKCDLFLGIIWKKFGSPTGGKNDKGGDYESGTEEEFDNAYNLWKKFGKPEIFFLKSKRTFDINDADIEQLEKVKKFFSGFSYNKEHPGLYKEFKTDSEFVRVLRLTLIQYAISNYLNVTEKEKESTIDLPRKLVNYGFENIFVPEFNDIRNSSKIESLSTSKDIYLIAHSGYSFIAQFGHRFRHIIEDKLSAGYNFKAVLTNPWSESGFFISLSEVISKNMDSFYITDANGNKYLDCIKVIEQAKWYQVKFTDSINGYQKLRKQYGDRIQIKFTRFEIQSSILLTSNNCYIEPYLPVNLEERYAKGMLTFELKLSNNSYLYEHNKKYFEFLWSLSDDIDVYKKNINIYKEQLKSKLIFNWEV